MEEAYRVLVVDDDPDVAGYTKTVLERKGGFEVRTANDARLVDRVVREFHPDVVVTDIEMPGMSGLDLVAQLRAEHPPIPVIVMTAHGSVDYAVRALRNQADEFFTKPVNSAELIAAVRRCALEARQQVEETTEVVRAGDVQRSLLPAVDPVIPGYQLSGACTPARVVGGDFYDWSHTLRGQVFALADVMGKGMGAALIAATARAVLRSHAEASQLVDVMSFAARELESDLSNSGTFITLFLARLDAETGVVHYVDAGHGLTIVVRADGSVARLADTGLPLGIAAPDSWSEQSVELNSGDTLVSVSDGVLEVFTGELEDLSRVADIVSSSRTAAEIVAAIAGLGGADATDDVTAVALRRL